MTKIKHESQRQILERYRDAVKMPKTLFCEALDISRPSYDSWLMGAEISLKTLSYLSVDFVNDWRGKLASELIRTVHGDQYLPIGSQDEVREVSKYFETLTYDDLCKQRVAPGHLLYWAAELRARHDAQLEAVKAQMRKDRVKA